MLPMRSALDAGQPREAIRLLDEEMGLQSDADLPADITNDKALFVLDRGSVQQSLSQFDRSKRDFEAADKSIDMLDLAHDAKDTIGEYVFSGSSGRYRAPPHEKLLINTLDMINYLELRDLNGARVEARRLAVMQRYVNEELNERHSAVLGLGGLLAGLTFEKSDEIDEALRWYDEALRFSAFQSLSDPVRLLLPRGQYRSPRLKELQTSSSSAAPSALEEAGEGEVVFVVGYGRVPHKVAHRIPIGLALTWYADALAPADVDAANRLAAQGLVTWINFPALEPESVGLTMPTALLDGRNVPLEEAVNVTREVHSEWKRIEGKIIVSAITRMIARYAAGSAVEAAAGKEKLLGALLSLGTQATFTALDTPDTRSWETLPARVAIARVRVPAGKHSVRLDARGITRTTDIDIDKGGWALVSLMGLR
jgi:tetratricopeptide (TPR) repeat protein